MSTNETNDPRGAVLMANRRAIHYPGPPPNDWGTLALAAVEDVEPWLLADCQDTLRARLLFHLRHLEEPISLSTLARRAWRSVPPGEQGVWLLTGLLACMRTAPTRVFTEYDHVRDEAAANPR
jgi:hypothetical protein